MLSAALAQTTGTVPPLSTEILLIFGLILVALVLFVTEPLPIDIIAIGVLVSLVVLEPWTGVDATTGISGFASTATVTVLAMFILSEGVRQTGLVNIIGSELPRPARPDGLTEDGASCFQDALCRNRIGSRRERSLRRH